MSIVTLPPGLLVGRQDPGLQNFDLSFSNSDSGASQVARLGPPRLKFALSYDEALDNEQAALWTSLLFALDGRVNLLAVHHILRPVPRGTLRGAPTLSSSAAAGAETMTLSTGQPGATLLRGDWIGVNQGGTNRQLLHVQADAIANGSGVMTVTFRNRLRVALGAGSTVVWDKPTCLMRQVTDSTGWSAQGVTESGFRIELMEEWLS